MNRLLGRGRAYDVHSDTAVAGSDAQLAGANHAVKRALVPAVREVPAECAEPLGRELEVEGLRKLDEEAAAGGGSRRQRWLVTPAGPCSDGSFGSSYHE